MRLLAAYPDDLNKETSRTISNSDVLNWSVSLLIVLVVFFLCVWAIRKSGYLSSTAKSELGVLAGLSLGMRERVVLVKVGGRQLLLGVTPGRIEKLLELEGDDQLFQGAMNEGGSDFAKKLRQAIKGRANE